MVDLNPTISITALHINGLTSPIKRQELSEWIKKAKLNYCVSLRNPLSRHRWDGNRHAMQTLIERPQNKKYYQG